MSDEIEKNERLSGSDRERNHRGDFGSGRSGSDGELDGSDGKLDGSGGSIDGSDGSVDGSDGSGGNVGSDGSGGSVGNPVIDANLDGIGRDKNNANYGRRKRDRGRSIRIGSFGSGNSESGNGGSDGSDADDNETKSIKEPAIRLGSNKQKKPKNVESDNQTSFKISDSKDLISIFIGTIFDIPATILKQDFWHLTKEENKTLTDAIINYLESLPKGDSSKIAAFINKHFPVINLAMIAFFIISDRVKQSMQFSEFVKRGKVLKMEKDQAANGQGYSAVDAIFN